jgi:hypothetical protein
VSTPAPRTPTPEQEATLRRLFDLPGSARLTCDGIEVSVPGRLLGKLQGGAVWLFGSPHSGGRVLADGRHLPR